MHRVSYRAMSCSVAQCLEVVGEWWSLLIVRDCLLGVTRFDDFVARLGIARNVLRQRLTTLVDAGVLVRVPYSEHPPRFEYRLTDKGRDLWPVVNAMRQWGDRHAAPDGPPVELVHERCGHVATAVPTCSECHQPLDVGEIRAVAGPGAADGLVIGPPPREASAKRRAQPGAMPGAEPEPADRRRRAEPVRPG